jgi:hypothetical protein
VFACSSAAEAHQHGRHQECVALPTILVAPRRRRIPSAAPKLVTIGMPADEDDGFPNVMWLVPLDGPLAGETLRIEPSSAGCTLGGQRPADIIIPDGEIATLHATITSTGYGATIVDAGSETGTYVNDRQITRHELVDNDLIRIGGTRLQFKSII